MGDDEKQEAPANLPKRVVPLKALAARSNTDGSASADNQARLPLLDGRAQFAAGLITAAQMLSAALYFCTLAICERLDSRDAPALIKEIAAATDEQNGKLN
jgi:hypothetical protein